MLRVELHPEASQEVSIAVDWYEARRAGLGAEFFTELRGGLRAIAASPTTFPLWPDARARTLGIHRLVLRRFPFVVPYMVLDERVFVLAIAHARRHPSYWLRRAPRSSHH
jgi:toxin ParE1/3/4